MTIPDQWCELPTPSSAMLTTRSRNFALPNGGEFSFYDRGMRISDYGGNKFCQTLNKPPDNNTQERKLDLVKDAVEVSELRALFNDFANQNKFKIEELVVRRINNRNLLMLIGEQGRLDENQIWHSSGERVCNFFIDKFGKGDAIEELHLSSPNQNFPEYRKQLNDALKSIVWKQ